ncbi:DUF3348 family protein [Rubrivivax gelatinosus]|uniref:DUF3348 family protein n=2 Tax=Rubrivivax gelatinosus TaxID=28068 RepID=UPI0018CB9501|nr:DUF3348 family protein [Rubrivivax gelatinosus]
MLHGSASPGVAGSELTRLLARLADGPPTEGRPAFGERLGHWLGWAGAISLASALAAGQAVPAAGRTAGSEDADFRRVRAALEAAIAAGPAEPATSPDDFGPFHRHCLGLQQGMHDAVAALRRRLREALSRRSAALARVAAIDAALEPALAAQERRVLALVPQRLMAHFERLGREHGEDAGWLAAFREDLDEVMRAELAHRLLPVQGLLQTLHDHDAR